MRVAISISAAKKVTMIDEIHSDATVRPLDKECLPIVGMFGADVNQP